MTPSGKPAGRPRDMAAAAAIKKAALRLIRQRGYHKVSIAMIVAEAGVARQTLYNNWNTKADLVLDAILEETNRFATTPTNDPTLTGKQQLTRFLSQVFSHLSLNSGTLRSLIAAAQDDPTFRAAFKTRFVTPREKLVTDLLKRAQDRGEIDPDSNLDILSAFIHGAFWYALLNGDPLEDSLAERISAEIFRHPAPTPPA